MVFVEIIWASSLGLHSGSSQRLVSQAR